MELFYIKKWDYSETDLVSEKPGPHEITLTVEIKGLIEMNMSESFMEILKEIDQVCESNSSREF